MCSSCQYWASDFVGGVIYCESAPDDRRVPGDVDTCLSTHKEWIKTSEARSFKLDKIKDAMKSVQDLTEAEVLETFRNLVAERVHES
jgi:hypothetical protein